VEVTVPDCVSHVLIKSQRTVQNHTQDFKFVSRGYRRRIGNRTQAFEWYQFQ